MKKQILIFDSSLGGLTILEHIHHTIPNCSYTYAADQAAFPYGNKKYSYLLHRVIAFLQQAIACCNPDIIIIACNTVSTIAINVLRQEFTQPFVAVVPAIKPAALLSTSKTIGLLATKTTISGDYINNLHKEHANNCNIIKFDASQLVELAENKLQGIPVSNDTIQRTINTIISNHNIDNIDTLVLGCTHFPVFSEEIKTLWPRQINIIDSGAAIANRTKSLLQNIDTTKPKPHTMGNILLTTKTNPNLAPFKNFGITKAVSINI